MREKNGQRTWVFAKNNKWLPMCKIVKLTWTSEMSTYTYVDNFTDIIFCSNILLLVWQIFFFNNWQNSISFLHMLHSKTTPIKRWSLFLFLLKLHRTLWLFQPNEQHVGMWLFSLPISCPSLPLLLLPPLPLLTLNFGTEPHHYEKD